MRYILGVAVLCFLISPAAKAQTLDVPRYELGLQLDFNYLDGIGDWGGGSGVRFHYNFDEHLALDSELLYRQHGVTIFQNPLQPQTGAIGQTTGLFGLRAGQRVEEVGFFVHARAGFLHFGSDNGATLLTRHTVPAFDVGGTLERYAGPVILRLDLGEMIVRYGNATVSSGGFPFGPPVPPPGRLGTRASPVVGLGIAFRF
ncbi:MAG TPA: hypothetical protein VJN93_16165 [Candidatus Acidoferrum sp.]|nr:hypothetical protein [Candidatus Acidoferrum sp.]